MIKIIASDMDGTFLNGQGSYDRERFEALLKTMKERDIRFVAASGNRMNRLYSIFSGMENDLDYVAENGALVIDDEGIVAKKTMDKEIIQDILAYFSGHLKEYRMVLSGEKWAYVLKGAKFEINRTHITEEQAEQFLKNMVFLDHFDDRPQDEGIIKATMMVDAEIAEEISKDFNANFPGNLTAVTSGYGAIDIIQTAIHKAWGLQALMDKYGVSRNQVAAFGDGGNDIEMLQLAGYSFAVANAPQEVKDIASYQAPSNTEDGVLDAIEALLLDKIK